MSYLIIVGILLASIALLFVSLYFASSEKAAVWGFGGVIFFSFTANISGIVLLVKLIVDFVIIPSGLFQ